MNFGMFDIAISWLLSFCVVLSSNLAPRLTNVCYFCGRSLALVSSSYPPRAAEPPKADDGWPVCLCAHMRVCAGGCHAYSVMYSYVLMHMCILMSAWVGEEI